jgi:large subunit ribosomal protein L30
VVGRWRSWSEEEEDQDSIRTQRDPAAWKAKRGGQRTGVKKKKIRIQYVRSAIRRPGKQKEVVRGLGLRKLNQVVERVDRPEIRGMVAKIPHLVRIVEEDK